MGICIAIIGSKILFDRCVIFYWEGIIIVSTLMLHNKPFTNMIKARWDLDRSPVASLMVFWQQEARFPLNQGMLDKPDLVWRLVSAADVATALT